LNTYQRFCSTAIEEIGYLWNVSDLVISSLQALGRGPDAIVKRRQEIREQYDEELRNVMNLVDHRSPCRIDPGREEEEEQHEELNRSESIELPPRLG
jgi:hypothetical protein